MHNNKTLQISICIFLIAVCNSVVPAAVKLPAVIGDNMVLQRGRPLPIWGWADKGEEVTVTIVGQTLITKASKDGHWKVVLKKLDVGRPLEMRVHGSSGTDITLRNILVGDVWLCSGQSNMEMRVSECNNAETEIKAADYPEIRLLSVPARGTQEPQCDFKGQWVQCNPETVERFSGVAYFFGRRLQKEINIPVGLIHCSWGASSCEAWIKRSVLESHPQYKNMLKRWDKRMSSFNLSNIDRAERQYIKWSEETTAAKAAGKVPPLAPENMWEYLFLPRRRPSNCYNGMLLPLVPYAIRGVIWYQGETNADRAYQYQQLFPLMIGHWREEWAQGDFPFYFVQLANYMPVKKQPGESAWAELREAQTMTLRVPNTGMAVGIDIGDAKDIHPKNKQDVGQRLALWALAKTYGKEIVYSGPLYRSMEVIGNKIVLHFDHCAGGLVAKGGGPLVGFAIADADKNFVWAEAEIVGDKVVVSSPKVSEPLAVRYAWADNPICNLYNREGLPASPFRTDMWKGVTEQ